MFSLIVGLLILLAMAHAGAAPYQPAAGHPFPVLQLPSLDDGRLRSVADFRGQKLVLHIWASW